MPDITWMRAVLVTVSGSRHKIKREEESNMLIIDGNSVYEIDEECVRKESAKGMWNLREDDAAAESGKDREYAARDQNTKRP